MTATILAFLSNELDHRGTDILPTADLAALSAIERHLNAASVPIFSADRAVAWIASACPHADPKRFQEAFGASAAALLQTLVPIRAIRPTPLNSGRATLQAIWAKATAGEDSVARTLAVALLAGEAQKTSDVDDRERFLGILDIALKQAGDPKVRLVLSEIHADLKNAAAKSDAAAARRTKSLLIALSIDVSGSTEAKRRIRDLATNEIWRAKLYKRFYGEFLHEEDRFYGSLFAPGMWGSGPPLDWRRLFVVKGIGDELWLTYDAMPLDEVDANAALQQATVRIVSAALSLCERTLSCGGTAEDTGPHFDPQVEERQRFEHMELPFKISIDLVEDAIEISSQRLTHFANRAGEYLDPPTGEPGRTPAHPFGAEHAEILNRLNAGFFMLAGGHRLRRAYRTDYIGTDIDQFFRITRFALPGVVMVGDKLMQKLRLQQLGEVAPEIDEIALLFPPDLHHPESVVTTGQGLLRMRQNLAPKDLKGLDAPYAVHHVIQKIALRGLLHEATLNPFLSPTIRQFPDDISALIKPRPFEADNVGDDA